eukprot:TRINITY_DN3074_c0_g1_i4.p1 TRINITY_DN3074_c0_g1~~TRINITY_DN3074_c0_g1_i4.p1  ORF type:complete len:272 (+),score=31.80 TRINITY_DN3074_c0_g1_i4:168-983(+)
MSISDFKKGIQELASLVEQKSVDKSKGDQLVVKMKLLQIQLESQEWSQAKQNNEQLQLSRTFYEVLIEYYLKTKDLSNFELTLPRIKVYYEDLKHLIGLSDRYYKILGLRLLYLLSFNKMSEFHSLLETISQVDQQNTFVAFSVKLERSFQVGNYSSVLDKKQDVPDQLYNVFLERILETIRYELGRSAEKAYKSLTIKEALSIFYLNDQASLQTYINSQEKEAQENGCKWEIQGDRLVFSKFEVDRGSKIDADRMIKRMLGYAHELEKII